MKILVTGADGFLGKACLPELRSAGHQVVTTDRRGAVDHVGDLADPAFCSSLPDVDAVVHAAAVQYVSRDLPFGPREPYFHRNNVEATRLLCRRYSGRGAHFVNIGTSMMYAQNGAPLYRTSAPMQGQGVYSRSKLAAEAFVQALPNPHATIIPCIIGGPGREGLFRSFVSMAKNRGAVVYPGSGRHKINMVHVADAAALVRHVVDARARGLFNAAAPGALSIEEWIDQIEIELGLPRVRRLHLPLAPMSLLSSLTGFRLLAREQLLMLAQPHVLAVDESLTLGWSPQFDNARIVRDIARYVAATAGAS